MTHELPSQSSKQEIQIFGDKIVSQISVDAFIERFRVSNPDVQETLRAYPTLCYLLGSVTQTPQTEDQRPDGVVRSIHFLVEGSGMFGLTHAADAERWKGIFNHIMGTARQVFFLSEQLLRLTLDQKQQFNKLGFDINSLNELNPELLRNFMFISHAGRRQSDERTWHGLNDNVHPEGDSGVTTLALLKSYNADPVLVNLMRVETHAHHLAVAGKKGFLPNIVDNILTYCDWTFGQQPNTLTERFVGLRKSRRQPEEILNVLESCGNRFEAALKQVLGNDIFDRMINAGPYDWETQIRKAYSASSGLTLEELFPTYKQ